MSLAQTQAVSKKKKSSFKIQWKRLETLTKYKKWQELRNLIKIKKLLGNHKYKNKKAQEMMKIYTQPMQQSNKIQNYPKNQAKW